MKTNKPRKGDVVSCVTPNGTIRYAAEPALDDRCVTHEPFTFRVAATDPMMLGEFWFFVSLLSCDGFPSQKRAVEMMNWLVDGAR
jgi:hypothetical protein